MFKPNRFPIHRLALSCLAAPWLLFVLTLPGRPQSHSSTDLAYTYHSIVPMGADKIRLRPSQRQVDLMASAESSSFEGVERRNSSYKVRLVNAKGSPVFYYPDQVFFRLTVSAPARPEHDDHPFYVATAEDTNTFLLSLHLRVKVFQGLNAYEIEPAKVELIGMPANIPYDERIYRATFHLDHVPAEARLVLEVFDSKQERISRFHLELF